MSRYLVHRSDANAEQVYEALKACGVHVERLGRPVDALLYSPAVWSLFRQRMRQCGIEVEASGPLHGNGIVGAVLAEIKTAKGKTRSKAQAAFLKRWPGPVLFLRTVTEGKARRMNRGRLCDT